MNEKWTCSPAAFTCTPNSPSLELHRLHADIGRKRLIVVSLLLDGGIGCGGFVVWRVVLDGPGGFGHDHWERRERKQEWWFKSERREMLTRLGVRLLLVCLRGSGRRERVGTGCAARWLEGGGGREGGRKRRGGRRRCGERQRVWHRRRAGEGAPQDGAGLRYMGRASLWAPNLK